MRRASVSISSNIAEGFGRNGYKEKDQFYAVAFGSLLEVESQMLLSIEIGYLDKNTYNEIESLLVETQKVLVGLKKSNLTRKETLGSSR